MTDNLLQFVEEAKADLHDIWHYTVQMWGEKQAERYITALKLACYQLIESPALGKSMPDLGSDIRAYRCQHHYIFYLELPDNIIFLGFLHEKRSLLRHVLSRLP